MTCQASLTTCLSRSKRGPISGSLAACACSDWNQPRANAANIAPPATTGTRSSNIQPPPVAHPGVARTLAEAGCPAPFATGAAGCRTDPDWSGIDGGALLLSAASGDPSAGAPAPSTGHASAE